jgi:hypothetical protein
LNIWHCARLRMQNTGEHFQNFYNKMCSKHLTLNKDLT